MSPVSVALLYRSASCKTKGRAPKEISIVKSRAKPAWPDGKSPGVLSQGLPYSFQA